MRKALLLTVLGNNITKQREKNKVLNSLEITVSISSVSVDIIPSRFGLPSQSHEKDSGSHTFSSLSLVLLMHSKSVSLGLMPCRTPKLISLELNFLLVKKCISSNI